MQNGRDENRSRNLNDQIAMFPTPQARDWKGMQGQSYQGKAVDLPCAVNMFPTPTACDWKGRGPNSKQQGLSEIANLFPTPTTRDYKGCRSSNALEKAGRNESNSLPDTIEKGVNSGSLNPDWVEWLMGVPTGWTSTQPFVAFPDIPGELWPAEPLDIPRTKAGIKDRKDRLMGLGNMVVPKQCFILFKFIKEIQDSLKNKNATIG